MIQAVLTAALTTITYYMGAVAAPVIMLIIVMVIDYITGMISAWHSGTLSSRQGIFGIVKKLCYLFAVAAAVTVDWIIGVGFSMIGINMNVTMLCSVLVTIWLIINELISILENLTEIGVPIPDFLKKISQKLKITTEDAAGNGDDKHE